jgi:hypothetical protein
LPIKTTRHHNGTENKTAMTNSTRHHPPQPVRCR